MSRHSAWMLIVFCSLSSLAESTRIKRRASRTRQIEPDSDTDNKLAALEVRAPICDELITDGMALLADRLQAYYSDACGITKDYQSEDGTVTLDDEARASLCQDSCRDHPDLVDDAPDNSDLIKQCNDPDSKERLSGLFLHDAFDVARKSCPNIASDEVDHVESAPLVDVLDDEVDLPFVVRKEEEDLENVVDRSGEIHHEDPDTGREIKEDTVNVVKQETVVEKPRAPPVPKIKGHMIKQLRFDMDMKNAIGEASKPCCKAMKNAFKGCDYKGTGAITIAQVDDMFDKLSPEQKAETLKNLKWIFGKLKKDPATDSVTFEDWTFVKFGVDDAAKCNAEYEANNMD